MSEPIKIEELKAALEKVIAAHNIKGQLYLYIDRGTCNISEIIPGIVCEIRGNGSGNAAPQFSNAEKICEPHLQDGGFVCACGLFHATGTYCHACGTDACKIPNHAQPPTDNHQL